MNTLPTELLKAWEKRDPACVLTTVDAQGVPNTIYVSCCGLLEPNRILICNSAFEKTLANLEAGNDQASFLFFAPDLAAYQLKGRIRHHRDGAAYEAGQGFTKPGMVLRGVAEIEVSEVYKGGQRLL